MRAISATEGPRPRFGPARGWACRIQFSQRRGQSRQAPFGDEADQLRIFWASKSIEDSEKPLDLANCRSSSEGVQSAGSLVARFGVDLACCGTTERSEVVSGCEENARALLLALLAFCSGKWLALLLALLGFTARLCLAKPPALPADTRLSFFFIAFSSSASTRLCPHASEKKALITDRLFDQSRSFMRAMRASWASSAGSDPRCQ